MSRPHRERLSAIYDFACIQNHIAKIANNDIAQYEYISI